MNAEMIIRMQQILYNAIIYIYIYIYIFRVRQVLYNTQNSEICWQILYPEYMVIWLMQYVW